MPEGGYMAVKRVLRPAIIIPAMIISAMLVIFGGWYVLPVRTLDIVVLDKTVPATSDKTDSIIAYRKHYGLFWMLEHLRYRNPENKDRYDYRADYYGSVRDDQGTFKNKSIARLSRTPDLLYISDTYGRQDGDSGLKHEDIAAASTAHLNGATLIVESDIFSNKIDESVLKESESLLGIKRTSWTGRYIADMSDLSDIPGWVQSLHESQYGEQWDYSGAGILLVSDQGELIVLQQNSDFNQSMLTVSVSEAYRREFGRQKVNYYNWFVIVSAEYNSEVIAEFNLDLNKSGREKFSRISDSTTFPAVVRTRGGTSPAYFFAGDFNDYVAQKRFSRFIFAELFYRTFSYDRPGDITNFYWNFYYPLMSTILEETAKNRKAVTQPQTNTKASVRINGGRFEVIKDGEWIPFTIKGFNINAVMAGSQPFDYTRDITIYRRFLSEIGAMGGNCVRVYDLMPPEFYRALYEYNLKNPDNNIYFIQSIITPDNIVDGEALTELSQTGLKQNIEYVVDALHGRADVPDVGSRKGGIYIQDVSSFLLGFLIETDTDAKTVSALNRSNPGYVSNGQYLSSSKGAAEGLIAMLCDYTYNYQQTAYGYISPVGAEGNAALAPSLPWSPAGGDLLDLGSLKASEATQGSFFVSYALQPHDNALVSNVPAFSGYKDSGGSLPYGGYLETFLGSRINHPVLIDRLGISTNFNAFEKETSVNGLSETKQGEELIRMLRAVGRQKCLGGLISNYNDVWSVCSQEYAPYTLPLSDNPLWQNTLDMAQTDGVCAMEPLTASDIGMSIRDADRMREMQINHDAAYIYITLMLDGDIDYDKEQLIIGLDTYQRNNGEYLYDPGYFATSLSGMEYVIKFESKNSASLLVVPDYNRENGRYASRERYTGRFEHIFRMVYGSFSTSGTNFYQAGTTIHIRIPWNLLNFANPAKRLVFSDSRPAGQIADDAFGVQTTATDGILFSVLIADKKTGDSMYLFPLNKQSSGYKKYVWDTWDNVDYTFRQKDSVKLLSQFFNSID